MTREQARLERTGPNAFRLALPEAERALLAELGDQLRLLLTHEAGDPVLQRLFPPAYIGEDETENESEYRRLVGDELLKGRLGALAVIEETLDQTVLDEAQVLAWLGALNDMRLVLGTRLDVDEGHDYSDLSPDDPDAFAFAAYGYLSLLVGTIIDELAGWGDDHPWSGASPPEP